jgi:signal transduction histidine kinase/ligand-binding sensor domain-containing protein
MQLFTHGRRLRALAASLFALCLASPALALNPDVALRDYNHAAWGIREGAPAEIKTMAQTPDGWLWLGTSTGLFRFDGVHFERYAPASAGEVARRRVNELRAESNGDLWISYSVGGVSVLRKNGRIEHVVPLDSPSGSIEALAVDRDGSVWITSDRGFFVQAKDKLRKLGPEQGLPHDNAHSVLLDQYQQLWVSFKTGVYRLDRPSGKFTLVHAQANQDALVQSPDGRLWLSDGDSIAPLPLEKTLPTAATAPLPRPALYAPLESRARNLFDRDGNLWTRLCPEMLCRVARAGARPAGTLRSGRDADERRAPQATGPSRVTNALLEDLEGNLWVATQSGLERYRENSLTPVPLPQASGMFSMAGDTEGGVWLSDIINRVTWRLHADRPPERSPQHYAVLANARDGALLMSNKRSIERRNRGTVTQIPLPPGRDGKPVDLDVAGMQDDGKVLWTATAQTGLIGMLDGQWHPRSAFSLPDRIFMSAAGREPGERWMATGDSTMVFNQNGKLTTYNAGGVGLPTMVAVNEDVLLGGDQGLAVFTGSGFRMLPALRPEALAKISGMAISADGDRWFNGGQGVVHVKRVDWQAAVSKPGTLLRYELFGILDGYTGQAMLEMRLPSVFADSGGQLWFMTSGGVLRLSPGRIRRNTVAPTPFVLGLDAGEVRHDAVPGLRLPPGSQNFSLRFTAPGLGKPEAMRFQYQLSGINDDWQEAGDRRAAFYTNVAPGHYTFRVRAFNEDGVAGKEEARLDFEIAPRFGQTIWFKLLCGLAAAALLYLLYLYRLRAATRRVAEQLTVRMAERERIARTLHDTFLQSVQALILRLDIVSAGLPQDARRKLEPILDQASDTIVEGRDQVYELRTGRVDDVESAAGEAGRQLHADHPATLFDIAVSGARRKLRDTVAEEACEIAREALRNAFQHAGAARVQARVRYEREHFILQVVDDGAGIAPDAARKQKHYGLTGMHERAARAGGKLEIDAAPGGGTRVTLTVPARAAYANASRWWRRGGA